MSLRRISSFAIAVAVVFTSAVSEASEVQAHRQIRRLGKGIQGLVWPASDEIDIGNVMLAPRTIGDTVALVKGKYPNAKRTLLLGQSVVKLSAAGDFELQIPIRGDVTEVTFQAVMPQGDIEIEKLVLTFPGYLAYRRQLFTPKSTPLGTISVGLGISAIAYRETDVPSYSSFSLTAKASYSRGFRSSNWRVVGSGYLTALPITRSQEATARFLGLNLRAEYTLPRVRAPWRVSIQGGGYYTTMFVSSSGFGFRHLLGPQLFPTLARVFRNGNSLGAYFKFSPILDGPSFLGLSNHELAGGLYFSRPFSSGRSLSVTLDAARLRFSLPGADFQCDTVTLGAAYGF